MSVKPHHTVVAGVIFNQEGKVLLATRPQDKSFAGYWEFPGGKVEAGESAFTALQRELDEEIGLSIHAARPWLSLETERADARISLQFWQITPPQWSGTLTAREGQIFAWQDAAVPTVTPMLPNNAPILRALAIPTRLSGSLATGLHDTADRWHALPPARHHLAKDAALLLSAEDLSAVSINTPFWAIVHNRQQWLEVQDAAAVIWLGDAAELLSLLREGVSLPVFATYTNARQAALLEQAGLHGLINLTTPTETA